MEATKAAAEKDVSNEAFKLSLVRRGFPFRSQSRIIELRFAQVTSFRGLAHDYDRLSLVFIRKVLRHGAPATVRRELATGARMDVTAHQSALHCY